ncbi:MAG: sigma-70 family RNA polymerase sigma factor, partial [Gemmatimonadota bacterium]
LWRLALRLARGEEDDATDIFQETWFRATARLTSFHHDARLGPWLAGIAWNCWRERRRARGPEAGPFDDAVIGEPAADHEARLDLRTAVDALPEGYRTVLLMHDLEGYTHAEVGAALGVSAGTSKSQLSRARAALRARLTAPAHQGARRNLNPEPDPAP